MTPRRLLLALGLASCHVFGCTRGGQEAAAPVDQPPPEPPPVLAEVAPPPAPPPEPPPEPPPAPTLDLVATAVEAGDLTTFLAALDTAGLRATLAGPGPLTVFAPSDQAFAALPKGELDRLLKNKKKLAALLGHHVVQGAALTQAELAARPADAPPLRTLAGADLPPPRVDRADLRATNGVLHIVGAVFPAPGKPARPAAQPASAPARPAAADKAPATPAAPDKPAPPATPAAPDKPAPAKSASPAQPPAPG